MDKAFIIKTPDGIETYIGTREKIKSHAKKHEILEEMSLENWRIIEKSRRKK